MPFSGLVWMTSWVSCFLTSSQGLLKVPDYVASAFPASVFSVVSSPLEIPTPWGFSTQFSPGFLSSNSSVTTLPNLAFQIGASSLQFRPQPVQAPVRLPLRVDAVANTVCPPEPEQKKGSRKVATQPSSSSAVREKTSAHNAPKSTLPQQIVQAMQNLLPWRPRVEPMKTLASSVEVVSTHSGDRVGDKQNSDGRLVKRGFWRYSQLLASQVLKSSASKEPEQFQVWVKGRIIAQFPKQQQANQIVKRLKEFLSNSSDPYLKTSPVEPTLFKGRPGVKVGDRVLFKIDDALAKNLGRNPELLVVEWANNLRITLGKTPLQLAEAQKRMYNLLETPKTFEGRASWYGPNFHGRPTATGETYNQHELTAAHPTLPFNTFLKVKNLQNGKTVVVRINDRGPYIPNRSLDLSQAAARCINSEQAGIVPFEAVIMRSPSGSFPQYLVRNQDRN